MFQFYVPWDLLPRELAFFQAVHFHRPIMASSDKAGAAPGMSMNKDMKYVLYIFHNYIHFK